MLKKVFSFLFFFLAATMLFSTSAFAYIDSSSMTYLIQILAGVVIAVGAGVGFYWKRIKRWFHKRKEAKSGAAMEEEPEAGLAQEDGQDVAEEVAARFAKANADQKQDEDGHVDP